MLHTPVPYSLPPIVHSSRFSPTPKPPRRKRVNFEEKAFQMADKHDAAPTAMKPPKEFRENVVIRSASSWDKVTLALFHVAFDRYELSDLQNFLDVRYFEPPEADEECYSGYNKIIRASEDARGVDFSMGQQDLVRRFADNPLDDFFCTLGDFLVTPSAEAIDLNQAKMRSRTPSPKKKARTSKQNDKDESNIPEEIPNVSLVETPSFTSPPSTPASNKRVFSGESHGHSSTETTPNKINHLEPLTQALQNDLIRTIIKTVWSGGANIPWAQNRIMYLVYRPDLKFTSSFRCRLDGNNGEADDRIIAIPDGALVLITDKKSNKDTGRKSRLIWSLQSAALAFEAKKADVHWVETLTKQGLPKAEAQAQAIAAQIWAEMLGLVCHPEYYKLGEQKAFIVHFSGFHVSIYHATFPSEYLSTIQNEGVNALKSKFKDPLRLHHTAPRNLLDADARLQFLKDFIAIVRCLADGNAPIGYLRRDDPGGKIHRMVGDSVDDEVVRPPQQALEPWKEADWRVEYSKDYAE